MTNPREIVVGDQVRFHQLDNKFNGWIAKVKVINPQDPPAQAVLIQFEMPPGREKDIAIAYTAYENLTLIDNEGEPI